MSERYYAVWTYYLPSTRWVKGYYSPIFTSKKDAELYAQNYILTHKRRGACVVRCERGFSNVQIYNNGNEFEPHFIYSAKVNNVIHNKDREAINKFYVKKEIPAPFGL